MGVLNDAMLALMTSMGHQTGLFDTMAAMPPSTNEVIADAANLNERYTREWLGAMVVGGIVDHDPAKGTYFLPPEHASCLTRAAGPDNLASVAQFVPLLGNVEGGVIDSFRNGGGVPYSAYTRFQEIMAEDSSQVYGATLIEATLPLVPGLVERLRSGAEAVDVGCGHGVAVTLMAEAFPNSSFAGYDLSKEGIAAARSKAKGLENARFEVRDVTAWEERERYQLGHRVGRAEGDPDARRGRLHDRGSETCRWRHPEQLLHRHQELALAAMREMVCDSAISVYLYAPCYVDCDRRKD